MDGHEVVERRGLGVIPGQVGGDRQRADVADPAVAIDDGLALPQRQSVAAAPALAPTPLRAPPVLVVVPLEPLAAVVAAAVTLRRGARRRAEPRHLLRPDAVVHPLRTQIRAVPGRAPLLRRVVAPPLAGPALEPLGLRRTGITDVPVARHLPAECGLLRPVGGGALARFATEPAMWRRFERERRAAPLTPTQCQLRGGALGRRGGPRFPLPRYLGGWVWRTSRRRPAPVNIQTCQGCIEIEVWSHSSTPPWGVGQDPRPPASGAGVILFTDRDGRAFGSAPAATRRRSRSDRGPHEHRPASDALSQVRARFRERHPRRSP